MSKRESIASDIITQLTAMTTPTLKKITREPFNVDELSEQQYPAAFIQSGNESRNDITILSANITRQATADFIIVGYVKGTSTNIDTKRNELISGIESILNSDRTRSGYAKDTQIVEISTDEGVLYPIGGIRIIVRILYHYTSGTP